MDEPDSAQYDEHLEFQRLRRKLIGFLKLPAQIEEAAFRDALGKYGGTTLRDYLSRAERTQSKV